MFEAIQAAFEVLRDMKVNGELDSFVVAAGDKKSTASAFKVKQTKKANQKPASWVRISSREGGVHPFCYTFRAVARHSPQSTRLLPKPYSPPPRYTRAYDPTSARARSRPIPRQNPQSFHTPHFLAELTSVSTRRAPSSRRSPRSH